MSQPLNDDVKKLVFSFIKAMRDVQVENPNASEVPHLLGEVFGVDPAGMGGTYDCDVDLLEIFKAALREKEKTADVETDEKFVAFVELLEKKGYFKDTEKGTPEYEQRMSKARDKFNQRNNPYEGLTAEQIKNKGNELMSQAKYKEAIAYYTKSIEMDSQNAVYFSNRAAAYTHMKDYKSAIIDCERAIAINPSFSKPYSRLGTAFFYQKEYANAVDAFGKACELDPDNASYKEDLERAQENLKSAGGSMTGAGGFPGFGGMGDMSNMGDMFSKMNNPEFLEAAQRMMQNPEFSKLVGNMASRVSQGGGFNPEDMGDMANAVRQVDEDGNLVTPFGKVNKEAMENLQREAVESNPKFAAIMQDVRANGFGAFQKYMGDPDVMELMIKFQNLMMGGGQ